MNHGESPTKLRYCPFCGSGKVKVLRSDDGDFCANAGFVGDLQKHKRETYAKWFEDALGLLNGRKGKIKKGLLNAQARKKEDK